MLLAFLFLLLGFALLVKGADWLVDGASSLAKRLNVSELAIGLTVVALGTSLPELVVNIFSSAEGHSGIVFGNILGSNFANLLLILGVSGIVFPVVVERSTLVYELPFSLLAALLLGFLVYDGVLSRLDAVILLVLFIGFLWYVYRIPKEAKASAVKVFSAGKTSLLLLGGLAALILGGKFTVDSAVVIARGLGITETLIALTVVAIGTSLPELFTSIVALRRRRSGLAVGNIVGSNIFNILFILGVSAAIRPAPFDVALNADILFLLIATALLFGFLLLGAKKRHVREYVVTRSLGTFLLLLYIGFLAFSIVRG